MPTLTAIILTYNESPHIERCIRSVGRVADEVLVVDSYSADDTVALARTLDARVLQHSWTNHAVQTNWALANGNIESDWVMRIDADEYLDETLAAGLRIAIERAPETVGGFEVDRRIRFLGRTIQHGGMAPLWVTRIWRNGWARCESRWMDEHMVLTRGRIARTAGALIDENLQPLAWWTQKHNDYSSREAIDLLGQQFQLGVHDEQPATLNPQARRKRWLRTRVYARLPLGVRPWVYFFYRAIIRLGILDGPRGMAFHTMQGLWYRMLVDTKVLEVRAAMSREGWSAPEAIRRILGIDVERAADSEPTTA